MDALLIYLAGGRLFPVGLLLILLGIAVLDRSRHRALRSACNAMILLGATCVFLSTTPLPLLAYLLWATGILFVWTLFTKTGTSGKMRLLGISFLAIFNLTLVALEFPFYRSPTIHLDPNRPIYVIGDSISAGIRSDERPWPAQLEAGLPTEVINLARPGSQVSDATRQSAQIDTERALVIVAIGGNDLLGGTSASEFRRDLDAILAGLHEDGHQILMLELPLLPFQHAFGSAQRELAARYDAFLLPKHRFAKVLATQGNTVDGIHLSPAGHRAMADVIDDVLLQRDATN